MQVDQAGEEPSPEEPSPEEASSEKSGAGDAGAPCFEEAAALFLHATRANAPFFEFCVSERARHGLPLVFHLLGLAVRHRGALDKGGFVQCASFAALRVSSSATFAHALAATARDPAAHPELELFRDPSLDDPDPAPTAAAAGRPATRRAAHRGAAAALLLRRAARSCTRASPLMMAAHHHVSRDGEVQQQIYEPSRRTSASCA